MSATHASTRNFHECRREPCPVCGHKGWCRVFDDGGVECMRIESPTPCKSGGWLHWPHGRERDWRDQFPNPPRHQTTERAERPAGNKAQVDAAYRALLRRCPLSAAHRAHLEARGLTAEQIERHGYATLPADREERARIAAAVAAELGWDPVGIVPGFIRKDGRLELANMAGILIPFRNVRGQIRGLQVRLNNPGSGQKYVWFSAGDRDGGIGQNGNICHVARPSRPTSTRRIVVTEGPIKANIAADHFNCIVLAIAGVANIADVVPALKALSGVEDVAIAYDKDAEVNVQVAMHEAKLALEVDGAGFRVAQWDWLLEDGKGIDDLIGSGILPFPIPHPALTRDRPRSDDPEQDSDLRFRDLSRLHSWVNAARRSPNLGAERHTLTDFALSLAGAPEGEPVPIPYPKLADQVGVSASTAERQLAKVGIRPSAGDAGILNGLIAVDVRPVPEKRNEITGQVTGGYDCLHVRRLAPVVAILERIATAPTPETGKRNNHGGKRTPCPRCGETTIERTTTDRCADCGALIKQTVRIITDDEATPPPPQDAADPQGTDAHEHEEAKTAGDTPPQHNADEEYDSPSETVTKGQQLAADPPTASCGAPPVDAAEARRAAARADLERRYGPPPPAWQDLTPAQSVLTEADHANDEAKFHRATSALGDYLADVARATGRTSVPKPPRTPSLDPTPRGSYHFDAGD